MRVTYCPRNLSPTLRAPPFRPLACPLARSRYSSTEVSSRAQSATASLSPRWLSDVKQRIGKCITFGLGAEQTTEAGLITQEIARDWRELLAGNEGFLTGPKRRGLFRHRVVWGENDSMVCGSPCLLCVGYGLNYE